jgi:histidine triad (HIT) family protein
MDCIKKSKEKSKCTFCKIVEGKLDSWKIYEDEEVLCFLDINPIVEGHSLIIPKRHVNWFYELEDDEIVHLFKVAKVVAEKIERGLNSDFVSLMIFGEHVPHVHIHLLPRTRGDIFEKLPEFPSLEEIKEIACITFSSNKLFLLKKRQPFP